MTRVLLFLALSCATSQEAGRQRLASRHLWGCLRACGDSAFEQRTACVAESRRECVAFGLEPGCALDNFEHERRVW